jgi:cyclophilin family peptidyl-prolyl cis-trans isomerase
MTIVAVKRKAGSRGSIARLLTAALTGALVAAACGGASSPSPTRSAVTPIAQGTASRPQCSTVDQTGQATKATITLAKGGSIVVALRPDKAPGTVANFAKNARECKYDGLVFHRVEPNFVIQGGDPLGTGTGGGTQPTELNDLPFTKGSLGIARGSDIRVSNLMQFFVCIGSCGHLNRQYTNFGQVTSGQEVADAVRVGDRIEMIRIE